MEEDGDQLPTSSKELELWDTQRIFNFNTKEDFHQGEYKHIRSSSEFRNKNILLTLKKRVTWSGLDMLPSKPWVSSLWDGVSPGGCDSFFWWAFFAELESWWTHFSLMISEDRAEAKFPRMLLYLDLSGSKLPDLNGVFSYQEILIPIAKEIAWI